MKKLVLLVCCLLCVCSQSDQSALNKKELGLAAAYLTIIHLQEKIAPGNPVYQDSLDARLARIGFDKEQFETSVQSLQANPERWETFYEYILGKIEQKEKSAEGNPPDIENFTR